jgi:ribosomal protein S7
MSQQKFAFSESVKRPKKPLRNIAFDFSASIETRKSFEKLTVDELVDAMRKRLSAVKKANEIEAFGFCDEYEIDELISL